MYDANVKLVCLAAAEPHALFSPDWGQAPTSSDDLENIDEV